MLCVLKSIGYSALAGTGGRSCGQVAGAAGHTYRIPHSPLHPAERTAGENPINTTVSDMILRTLALLLITLMSIAASAREDPYRVLLLQSYRSALPINAQLATAITKGLNEKADLRVEIDVETLDLSRLDEEKHAGLLIEIYKIKYRAAAPDIVIATGDPALQFLLKYRQHLFPDVPIVFCDPDKSFLDSPKIPPNMTGVASWPDPAGTLELMAQLHPDMQRVVLIIGSGNLDRQWEQVTRRALLPYESRFDIVWLRGIPLGELVERVSALSPRTVILYLAQFADRNGVPNIPRQTAQAVAEAANSPVYGLWDTLMGTGIVGGRLVSMQHDGELAGEMARRILLGEAPATIPPVMHARNDVMADARQLRKWGIRENSLPPGSHLLYRKPSVWQEHRSAITLGAIIITLLCLVILALLWNRTKLERAQIALKEEFAQRTRAERMSRRLRNRMNAAEKHSSLGVLAAGIAHEVNQPLISIQNYAQAAKQYIPSDAVHEPKLNELLTEIESEAGRAGTIIQKTRKLLASGRVDALPTVLDSILQEVLAAMRPEIESHGCRIACDPGTPVPAVLVDPLQIQLVLGNLFHNALQAMESTEERGDKLITITVRAIAGHQIQISVADRGSGIPADADEEVFDPLYTTKPKGMGVGLSASRTIIEAHGGRIWHTPNPLVGTIFHFTLPIAGPRG